MQLIRTLTLWALLALVPLPLLQANGISSWGSKALSIFNQAPAKETLQDSASAFNSTAELASALREALAVAAERALTQLGQKGGFAESELFRVPLPPTVERLRKPLQLVGREDLLNDFQATLNHAAEQGVAAAPAIVKSTIQNLTLQDLNQLWKGEDDAITRFLEKQARDPLASRMRPLIAEATRASGATRGYQQIQSALPDSGNGIFGRLQSFTGIGVKDFDLDDYVNEHALDALFMVMANEEQAIRENPVARSTDLLKKLFGGR